MIGTGIGTGRCGDRVDRACVDYVIEMATGGDGGE